jgi:hypothetical protein
MMQGKILKETYFTSFSDEILSDNAGYSVRKINNAGHLKGPQALPTKQTLELNFNSIWDMGYCVNLSQVKVGMEGLSGTYPRKVFSIESDNSSYEEMIKNINSFTDSVATLGKELSILVPKDYKNTQ